MTASPLFADHDSDSEGYDPLTVCAKFGFWPGQIGLPAVSPHPVS
jgi:hypothetical protein